MKRKNKTSLIKNSLKAAPVLFAIVFVVYAGVLLKDIDVPTLLPVNDVQVIGELNFLDKDEIQAIVRNNVSGGYFTVDLKFVRELLLKKPWVKEVSLRRVWPASLNVLIEEQVPVAYWNDNAYLSEKGDVFEPESINSDLNLPGLNGPAGQHKNVWQFMNVLYKEMALLNYEVVRLDYDERRAWRLIVIEQDGEARNQIDVKLGRFDTTKRLQRFIRVLPALAAQKDLVEDKIRVIDMRYPNGFAVRLAEEQSASVNLKDAAMKTVTNKIINNKTKIISHSSVRLLFPSVTQVCEA